MNIVYILDGEEAETRRDWLALVGSPIIEIHRQGIQLIVSTTRKELPSNAAGVVFIHTSYCPVSALPEISGKYPKLILVALNAGGIPNGPRDKRYWSIGTPVGKQPTDLAFAARAKDFLKNFQKQGVHDFRRLEPNSEPVYALRLLCEAWWMNRNEKDESKVSESKEHNGITIHAPVTPGDWFSPFGQDVSEESAEEIAADFVSIDVSAEVKAFLLDIAKLKSVPPEGVRKLAKVLGVAAKTI
jgi:hypothetical protein